MCNVITVELAVYIATCTFNDLTSIIMNSLSNVSADRHMYKVRHQNSNTFKFEFLDLISAVGHY